MEKNTTIVIIVTDKTYKPVADAKVSLMVEGRSVGEPSKKTDKNGRASWSFPTGSISSSRKDSFNCHYSATKGNLISRGPGSATKNSRNEFHVILELKPSSTQSTDDRFEYWAKELKRWKRSEIDRVVGDYVGSLSDPERDALADVVWVADKSIKVLKGYKVHLSYLNYRAPTQVDRTLDELKALRHNIDGKTLGEIEVITKRQVEHLKKTKKLVSKASVAGTIVVGGFEFIDAVREGDVGRAWIAVGNTGMWLLMGLHPLSAAGFLLLHVLFHLHSLHEFLMDRPPRDPSLGLASRLTRLVKELNLGTIYPAFDGYTQYRLERGPKAWYFRDYKQALIQPGLGFHSQSAKGREYKLVLVLGDGQLVPVPTDKFNATQLEYILRAVPEIEFARIDGFIRESPAIYTSIAGFAGSY